MAFQPIPSSSIEHKLRVPVAVSNLVGLCLRHGRVFVLLERSFKYMKDARFVGPGVNTMQIPVSATCARSSWRERVKVRIGRVTLLYY